LYYIYGAVDSPASLKAEQLLQICKRHYKFFVFGRDFTLNQLQRLVPETQTVPHIYCDTTYIGGVKELYDHLYSVVSFEDEERDNEK
jgi:hypothetical protein